MLRLTRVYAYLLRDHSKLMSGGHFFSRGGGKKILKNGPDINCPSKLHQKNQNVRGIFFICSVFWMKTTDINWADINYECAFFSSGKMSRRGGVKKFWNIEMSEDINFEWSLGNSANLVPVALIFERWIIPFSFFEGQQRHTVIARQAVARISALSSSTQQRRNFGHFSAWTARKPHWKRSDARKSNTWLIERLNKVKPTP